MRSNAVSGRATSPTAPNRLERCPRAPAVAAAAPKHAISHGSTSFQRGLDPVRKQQVVDAPLQPWKAGAVAIGVAEMRRH